MGFSLPTQNLARFGFPLLSLGCVRADLFPSLPDSATMDLSLALHSFIHLGSAPLALDSASLGIFMLLRSFAYSGSSSFAMAKVRGLSFLALDFLHPDPASSLQSLVHFGLLPLLFGVSRLALSIPAPDASTVGFLMTLHGLGCVETLLMLCGLSRPGVLLSLVSYACVGTSSFCRGLKRSNLSSLALGKQSLDILLFALDACMTDTPLSSRSFARVESFIFACGFLQQDSALLLRSPCCIGVLLPTADLSQAALLLLAKSVACLGLSLLLLDSCNIGSSLFLRSLLQLDLASSLADFSGLEPPLSLKMPSCLGVLPSLSDFARCGTSLATLDFTTVGFLSPIHSLLRLEFVLAAVSASFLDLSFLLRSLAYVDLSSPLPGARMDFTASVSDAPIPGLLLSLHSFAWPRA